MSPDDTLDAAKPSMALSIVGLSMEYKSDDYESTSQSIAVIALLMASNVSSENANDILTIMADGD